MFSRISKALFFLSFIAPLAAACGAKPAVPAAENGGEGGVESALVTYSDSAQGFSIAHPGPWTQDTSVAEGVKFIGGGGLINTSFCTSPCGTGVLTSRPRRAAHCSAPVPPFKQSDLGPSTEVNEA